MKNHAKYKKMLFEVLKKINWSTTEALAKELNITRNAAAHLLNELMLEGKVHKVGDAVMSSENYQLRLESELMGGK